MGRIDKKFTTYPSPGVRNRGDGQETPLCLLEIFVNPHSVH